MESERQYIELYHDAADLIRQRSCAVMNAVRDAAFQAFASQGFPSRKVERYRYTDVAAAFAPNYGISLSSLELKPSDYIFSFKDAPIDLIPYYNKVADASDGITALNTALAHEGLLIYVPRNHRPSAPIQVDNWLRATAPTMMNRRVLILLEEGADATIVINDKADAQPVSFLTTQVIEVVCKANARYDSYHDTGQCDGADDNRHQQQRADDAPEALVAAEQVADVRRQVLPRGVQIGNVIAVLHGKHKETQYCPDYQEHHRQGGE